MRLLASVPKLVGSCSGDVERLLAGDRRRDRERRPGRRSSPTRGRGRRARVAADRGLTTPPVIEQRGGRMRVLPQGGRQRGGLAGGRDRNLGGHRGAFLARPAEVETEFRERQPIDLLPVPSPTSPISIVSFFGVDPETPRVPQAVGDDLGPGAGYRDERVLGRDRVGFRAADRSAGCCQRGRSASPGDAHGKFGGSAPPSPTRYRGSRRGRTASCRRCGRPSAWSER